ncbi:hypothetical protein GCM10008090_27710 [Arenicella chitinivorans]|uniref:Sel1 repeat family protein n=1 Tax=Arenicella chitinivorans TaxID=1329800 RepID=A0A918RYM5_9GAMM|nr:hypothetical protein GCM10008090_27710 [Arenicella chitinivorans]
MRVLLYVRVGREIEAEDELAIYWLTRAAENGHKSATYLIISRYYSGTEGFPKDNGKAKDCKRIGR